MKKFMEETIEELVGYPIDMQLKESFEKNGIDNQIIVTCMLCKKLDRLAYALESIGTTLGNIDDSLDYLTKCVGYVPPRPYMKEGYHIFRIGGQVETE